MVHKKPEKTQERDFLLKNDETKGSKTREENNLDQWEPVAYEELPHWLQDNEFIREWYRPPLPSTKTCLKSVFRIHNETGNIWTHLVASVAIFIGAANYWAENAETATFDKCLVTLGWASAVACYLMSALYHALFCHSERVCVFSGVMDYSGITLIMTCNYLPWVYFQFRGDPFYQRAYMSVILAAGILCQCVFLSNRLGGARFRTTRWCLFFLLALSGFAPLLHLHMDPGFHRAHLEWYYLQLLFNGVGGIVYNLRLPERWFPGKCDLLCHSHQVFHVCVVAAWWTFFVGVLRAQQQGSDEEGFGVGDFGKNGGNVSFGLNEWNF